ncbi:hypothetical protein U0070_024000 [Myodes glareolus]|uniref:Uncharacterized protein n=1 Tax=Myodes glareolus TaxID=447135 RepID=A0AAW0I552_MYOGA
MSGNDKVAILTAVVQEGEYPNRLDPKNPVYAEETSPSDIVNGFSERLGPATFRKSGDIQRIWLDPVLVQSQSNCPWDGYISLFSGKVQEGEHPNRLDPKNPVYAEETSPSVIVNGFSERLQASHIQKIRPHSENLVGSHARSVTVHLALVQEGEYPNRLDPQNPVCAEETSPSVIVNGFSERLRASHIQRIRPHSENLIGSHVFSSSSTALKMQCDIFAENKAIFFVGCAAQMWFFGLFVTTNYFILSVMVYDRYTAIWAFAGVMSNAAVSSKSSQGFLPCEKFKFLPPPSRSKKIKNRVMDIEHFEENGNKVQEGEHPNRLDPKNPVYAEETSPSVIVNGFSERLQASHIQKIRPHSENLVGSHARSVMVHLALQESKKYKTLDMQDLPLHVFGHVTVGVDVGVGQLIVMVSPLPPPPQTHHQGTGSHNPSLQQGQFYCAAQAKCKVLFPDAAADKGEGSANSPVAGGRVAIDMNTGHSCSRSMDPDMSPGSSPVSAIMGDLDWIDLVSPRVALNSQRSICLCLRSPGIRREDTLYSGREGTAVVGMHDKNEKLIGHEPRKALTWITGMRMIEASKKEHLRFCNKLKGSANMSQVQEGEYPNRLDPQNAVYAEETSPSVIVNGFSERLRGQPHSENPAKFRESVGNIKYFIFNELFQAYRNTENLRKILASPVKPPSLPDLSGAGDYNLIIIDLMATLHF